MTKKELIEQLHKKFDDKNLTIKLLGEVVDDTIREVIKCIREEGKFMMPSFGTFSIKERPARQGHNPRTHEAIEIAASKTIQFKPSSALKDALNGKDEAAAK